MSFDIDFSHFKSYQKDGRKSITEIYKSFSKLDSKVWNMEVVAKQEFTFRKRKVSLPILSFSTQKPGNALWIISGIHGEEPAGPNALAENIKFLNSLGKRIPLVLLPLCNPSGYARNWRYQNSKLRGRKTPIHSVGDSEHYLPSTESGLEARSKHPTTDASLALTTHALKMAALYPPISVIDFHEDESSRKLYIYSQGKLGAHDPIAKKIVLILRDQGFQFYDKGKTGFGEKILNGVVGGVKDGSIDELLASEKVVLGDDVIEKSGAKSVIVVETTTKGIPLETRVKAHTYVLKQSKKFFERAKKIS